MYQKETCNQHRKFSQNKRVRTQSAFELNLVLVARFELARYCYRGILSPFVSADSHHTSVERLLLYHK